MLVNNINGSEGKIEVTGLRAVVAMFLRWSLERRRESQSGLPTWTLSAALSYQKESLLLNKKLKKKITIKLRSNKEYEVTPLDGAEIVIDGNSLKIEGVTLCLVESPQ